MRSSIPTLALAGLLAAPVVSPAQQMAAPKTYSYTAEVQRSYQNLQRNLAEAAEKMPDEHYGFRATADVRPFGQLVVHTALAQFGTCARLKGEANPKKDEKEEAVRTRADTIALLKASTSYCDPLVTGLTDAAVTEMVKMGADQAAKGLFPMGLISHGNEMYGTMAVYLRLKGIVPPTTDRMNQMKKSE